MQIPIKVIRTESKGKNASKSTDELQYIMDFNPSITQAVAKALEHLTDFVFVSMGNLTLARRDSYLTHVKTGIKPDSSAALRTAPLQLATLFPDNVIKRAEDDIPSYESKGRSGTSHSKIRYHSYERPERKSDKRSERPAWKNIIWKCQSKKGKGRYSQYSSQPTKGQQSYKGSRRTVKCVLSPETPRKTLDIQRLQL